MNKKIIAVLLVTLSLLASFYVGFLFGNQKVSVKNENSITNNKQLCEEGGRGHWLEKTQACYGRTKEWCEENKGTPTQGNRCFDNKTPGASCPLNLEEKCLF